MTIFEYRVSVGWTQREMAERWKFSPRAIKDWESGKRPARRFNREKLRQLSNGAITDWPDEKAAA